MVSGGFNCTRQYPIDLAPYDGIFPLVRTMFIYSTKDVSKIQKAQNKCLRVNSGSGNKVLVLLWDTLDMNNFYFLLFSDFIGIFFFFLLDNEEAHDMAVTWYVTWCDVTSLEHDGRVWKMMSGHMKYTWWPWIEYETGIRTKYGH